MHYSELGFDTYDEYLDSPEWKEIRDIKYHSGDPYRCRICHARTDLRLHKRTYYNLTPDFFYFLLKNNRQLFQKILVYLCPRCNNLVHWYDGKKQKRKVPLDYLFLWEREKKIFSRPDMILRRFLRSFIRLLQWIRHSYIVELRKSKRSY